MLLIVLFLFSAPLLSSLRLRSGISGIYNKPCNSFDPFHFYDEHDSLVYYGNKGLKNYIPVSGASFLSFIGEANGADNSGLQDIFDPSNFQPVCPTSDGVYQVLKASANAVVGKENVVEYGPLIASLLLRVRLEICVLESFIYEAVVPFVQQKGISWILPLHETLETFFAGTIFAVACNIILLGSTKILSVLFIFFDAIVGFPARIIGGLLKKVTPPSTFGNIAGAGLKTYGDVSDFMRRSLETVDTFVGRYLVVITTGYVLFKLLHFKLFNDLF